MSARCCKPAERGEDRTHSICYSRQFFDGDPGDPPVLEESGSMLDVVGSSVGLACSHDDAVSDLAIAIGHFDVAVRWISRDGTRARLSDYEQGYGDKIELWVERGPAEADYDAARRDVEGDAPLLRRRDQGKSGSRARPVQKGEHGAAGANDGESTPPTSPPPPAPSRRASVEGRSLARPESRRPASPGQSVVSDEEQGVRGVASPPDDPSLADAPAWASALRADQIARELRSIADDLPLMTDRAIVREAAQRLDPVCCYCGGRTDERGVVSQLGTRRQWHVSCRDEARDAWEERQRIDNE